MSYEPREGVDYITDYYAAVGVEQTGDSDSIRKAIIQKQREYHPDRLQGLAPEFRSKGERMARLLNQAKIVLLDTSNRDEYNSILDGWDGPISNDGTPIVKIDDMIRAEAIQKDPLALEAEFEAQSAEVIKMTKYNPKQQAMLARMYEQAEGEDANELRDAYDDALFAEDQVLAIEEANRGQLIGLANPPRYETALDYAESVQQSIESARAEQIEEYQRRALGGVGARLALLVGESEPQVSTSILPAGSELPHYFDAQAEKVAEIAVKREEILAKRLAIFEPTYPVPEIQTDAQSTIAVGIEYTNGTMWIGFVYDADTMNFDSADINLVVKSYLENEAYAMAYDAGYNILTFSPKDQIEIHTLLEAALGKYVEKFYPETPDCEI